MHRQPESDITRLQGKLNLKEGPYFGLWLTKEEEQTGRNSINTKFMGSGNEIDIY